MFRLKTNKTKLYQLVAEYEAMPPVRRVTFSKAYRRPDYRMKWTDKHGLRHEAYFAAVGGRGKLSITAFDDAGTEVSRVVYTLDAKDLLERGMVEEFTTAAERRADHGVV